MSLRRKPLIFACLLNKVFFRLAIKSDIYCFFFLGWLSPSSAASWDCLCWLHQWRKKTSAGCIISQHACFFTNVTRLGNKLNPSSFHFFFHFVKLIKKYTTYVSHCSLSQAHSRINVKQQAKLQSHVCLDRQFTTLRGTNASTPTHKPLFNATIML